MRPLFHPSVDDVTVEGILHALADPTRVALYTRIVEAECAQPCAALGRATDRPIPKSTLSQHFKALREAGLIRVERHGVEMRNSARADEVDARFPGLIASIVNAHRLQLEREARVRANASRTASAKTPRRAPKRIRGTEIPAKS